MPAEPPPSALLFDLGGVLVDIDFTRALDTWAPHSALSREELGATFGHDAQYERHERGEIDGAEYFDHLAATLQLGCTREEIARGWNAIYVGEFVETRQLIESLRSVVPCYAFTNTNATHMATFRERFPAVVSAFDRVFASHELALRKPDPAAFERVCSLIGVSAASIAFFDDLPVNVKGAQECGLRAFLVRSPRDVMRSLRAIGLNP